MKKLVNGEVIEMTAEEIAERETFVANEEAKKTAEDNVKTAKATAQASGNQKLLDLGLTQAEATALTGYTPPVSE
jgi:hypothetical protein